MKTLKIFCLLFISSLGLNAQNIIIRDENGTDVTGDTIEVVFHPGIYHGWTEIISYVFVKNTGSSTMNMGVRKREYNIRPDEYHSFCFAGSCYDSSTYVAPYPDIVPSGGIDSTFSGHFRFDDTAHTPGISIVSYTFYNINNVADSAIVYVGYNTLLQMGVDENSTASVFLSNAFPNPATEYINVNYSFSNTGNGHDNYLIVSNIMGECISKQRLAQDKGLILVDTKSWATGTYSYSVVNGASILASKKFILTH